MKFIGDNNKINGNKPKNVTGKVCFRCEKIVKPENNEPICLCRLVKLSGLENIYVFPYIGAGIQIEHLTPQIKNNI